MAQTTTELTVEYIKEHPYIRNCLKQGLINYSSLARKIAKDLKIEKKTSKEAILVAARRFQEKLKKESGQDKKIRLLLSNSEMEIKNKINVFILDKNINLAHVDGIHTIIRKDAGTFSILEGSDNYTIITQEKYSSLVLKKFSAQVLKHHKDLVWINLKSSKDIENVKGVVSYLTSLFAENEVNLVEFLSCWTDTIFLIEEKDLNKAINFLRF